MGMGLLNLTSESIELKDDNGKRRFSMTAYSGGTFDVGKGPMVIDLAGLDLGNRRRPILRDHDRKQIVGSTTDGAVIDHQLHLEGTITSKSAAGREVIELADDDFAWEASVGVQPIREEKIAAKSKVTVNGREFEGPLTVVRNGRLKETSFVVLGADHATTTTVLEEPKEMITKEEIALIVAEAVKEQLKLELPKLALMATGHPGVTSVAASEQTDPNADIKAEMISAFGEKDGQRAFELYLKNEALGMFTAKGGSK